MVEPRDTQDSPTAVATPALTNPKREVSWTLTTFVVVPMVVGLILVTVGLIGYISDANGTPSNLSVGIAAFKFDIPATPPLIVIILALCVMVVPGALLLRFGGRAAINLLALVFASFTSCLLVVSLVGEVEPVGGTSSWDVPVRYLLNFVIFFVALTIYECLHLLVSSLIRDGNVARPNRKV